MYFNLQPLNRDNYVLNNNRILLKLQPKNKLQEHFTLGLEYFTCKFPCNDVWLTEFYAVYVTKTSQNRLNIKLKLKLLNRTKDFINLFLVKLKCYLYIVVEVESIKS